MTETKPTPGPWWLDDDNDDGINLGILANDPYGEPMNIAWVSCRDCGSQDRPEAPAAAIAEANGHLFAAAPDLLEALKECVDEMSQHIYPKPDVPDDHPYRKLQRAQAAIAKAEGRATEFVREYEEQNA